MGNWKFRISRAMPDGSVKSKEIELDYRTRHFANAVTSAMWTAYQDWSVVGTPKDEDFFIGNIDKVPPGYKIEFLWHGKAGRKKKEKQQEEAEAKPIEDYVPIFGVNE